MSDKFNQLENEAKEMAGEDILTILIWIVKAVLYLLELINGSKK